MRDTIDMAREAGVYTGCTEWTIEKSTTFVTRHKAIKAFEALVRADEREAAQAEHEADKVIIEYHEATIKRLEANQEVLMNALWKACGDDEEVVNATIESQGSLL